MGGSRNSTVTQIRMVSQLTIIIPESVSILASFMWLPDIPPFSKLPPFLPTTVHALEETPHNTMTWLMLSQSGFLTAFFFFSTETRRGKNPPFLFLRRFDPESCQWLHGETILLVFPVQLLSFSVTSDKNKQASLSFCIN